MYQKYFFVNHITNTFSFTLIQKLQKESFLHSPIEIGYIKLKMSFFV